MRKNFTPFALAFTVLALLFIAPAGKAQDSYTGTYGTLTEKTNTPMNAVVNGYIEVLPPGYDPNGSTTYPLLIGLEGISQFGDGSVKSIKNLYGYPGENMIPRLVKENNFSNAYGPAGNTHFIIIVPQVRRQVQNRPIADDAMASPEEMNEIINYILQHYKVDPTRIYLTGLSIGGGTVLNYPGEKSEYANRVAAVVTFAAASNPYFNRNNTIDRINTIANSNLPVWAFVNDGDYDVNGVNNATNYINGIKNDPDYTTDANAKLTIFAGRGGHDSWSAPYLGYLWNTDGSQTAMNPTIYDWMLQFSRTGQTQPLFATVNAGADQNITLPANSMQASGTGIAFTTGNEITLTGSALAPAGRTIVNTEWVKVNGTGGSITSPASLTTTITGLEPGLYAFQLRATDNQGLVTTDEVQVTVNKAPENNYLKVEAEDFTTKSGAVGETYREEDRGAASGLYNWEAGNYAEYQLNLPVTGTYTVVLRHRETSANITVSGGSAPVTRSLSSGNVWTDEVMQINFTTTTPLLRITTNASDGFNLNYIELAGPPSPLPVNFTFFNAACNGAGVDLLWKTAQEQNSKYFAVQKSTDGTKWNTIATVPAAGQSATERSYRYSDKNAAANSLYRIAEFDVDGKTTLTAIVKSNCGSKDQLLLYPNPASGDATLSVMLQRPAKVSYWVYDNKGALMFQGLQMLPAGTTTLPLATGNFAKGVYTIKVNYNGEVKSLQLVKK